MPKTHPPRFEHRYLHPIEPYELDEGAVNDLEGIFGKKAAAKLAPDLEEAIAQYRALRWQEKNQPTLQERRSAARQLDQTVETLLTALTSPTLGGIDDVLAAALINQGVQRPHKHLKRYVEESSELHRATRQVRQALESRRRGGQTMRGMAKNRLAAQLAKSYRRHLGCLPAKTYDPDRGHWSDYARLLELALRLAEPKAKNRPAMTRDLVIKGADAAKE